MATPRRYHFPAFEEFANRDLARFQAIPEAIPEAIPVTPEPVAKPAGTGERLWTAFTAPVGRTWAGVRDVGEVLIGQVPMDELLAQGRYAQEHQERLEREGGLQGTFGEAVAGFGGEVLSYLALAAGAKKLAALGLGAVGAGALGVGKGATGLKTAERAAQLAKAIKTPTRLKHHVGRGVIEGVAAWPFLERTRPEEDRMAPLTYIAAAGAGEALGYGIQKLGSRLLAKWAGRGADAAADAVDAATDAATDIPMGAAGTASATATATAPDMDVPALKEVFRRATKQDIEQAAYDTAFEDFLFRGRGADVEDYTRELLNNLQYSTLTEPEKVAMAQRVITRAQDRVELVRIQHRVGLDQATPDDLARYQELTNKIARDDLAYEAVKRNDMVEMPAATKAAADAEVVVTDPIPEAAPIPEAVLEATQVTPPPVPPPTPTRIASPLFDEMQPRPVGLNRTSGLTALEEQRIRNDLVPLLRKKTTIPPDIDAIIRKKLRPLFPNATDVDLEPHVQRIKANADLYEEFANLPTGNLSRAKMLIAQAVEDGLTDPEEIFSKVYGRAGDGIKKDGFADHVRLYITDALDEVAERAHQATPTPVTPTTPATPATPAAAVLTPEQTSAINAHVMGLLNQAKPPTTESIVQQIMPLVQGYNAAIPNLEQTAAKIVGDVIIAKKSQLDQAAAQAALAKKAKAADVPTRPDNVPNVLPDTQATQEALTRQAQEQAARTAAEASIQAQQTQQALPIMQNFWDDLARYTDPASVDEWTLSRIIVADADLQELPSDATPAQIRAAFDKIIKANLPPQLVPLFNALEQAGIPLSSVTDMAENLPADKLKAYTDVLDFMTDSTRTPDGTPTLKYDLVKDYINSGKPIPQRLLNYTKNLTTQKQYETFFKDGQGKTLKNNLERVRADLKKAVAKDAKGAKGAKSAKGAVAQPPVTPDVIPVDTPVRVGDVTEVLTPAEKSKRQIVKDGVNYQGVYANPVDYYLTKVTTAKRKYGDSADKAEARKALAELQKIFPTIFDPEEFTSMADDLAEQIKQIEPVKTGRKMDEIHVPDTKASLLQGVNDRLIPPIAPQLDTVNGVTLPLTFDDAATSVDDWARQTNDAIAELTKRNNELATANGSSVTRANINLRKDVLNIYRKATTKGQATAQAMLRRISENVINKGGSEFVPGTARWDTLINDIIQLSGNQETRTALRKAFDKTEAAFLKDVAATVTQAPLPAGRPLTLQDLQNVVGFNINQDKVAKVFTDAGREPLPDLRDVLAQRLGLKTDHSVKRITQSALNDVLANESDRITEPALVGYLRNIYGLEDIVPNVLSNSPVERNAGVSAQYIIDQAKKLFRSAKARPIYRPIEQMTSWNFRSLTDAEYELLPKELAELMNDLDRDIIRTNIKMKDLLLEHGSPALAWSDTVRARYDKLQKDLLDFATVRNKQVSHIANATHRTEAVKHAEAMYYKMQEAEPMPGAIPIHDPVTKKFAGYIYVSGYSGKHTTIPELTPVTQEIERLWQRPINAYQWYFVPARDVLGEPLLEQFRPVVRIMEMVDTDAQQALKTALGDVLAGKNVKQTLPNTLDRITLLMEGTQLADASDVERQTATAMISWYNRLFNTLEVGISGNDFFKKYFRQIREAGSMKAAFPDGVPDDLAFFAGRARVDDLTDFPIGRNALTTALDMTKLATRKRYLSPVFDDPNVRQMVELMHPNRKAYFDAFKANLLGKASWEENMLNGMIDSVLGFFGQAIGPKGTRRLAGEMASTATQLVYMSTLAGNVNTALRGLTQSALTIGALDNNIGNGLKYYSRALRSLRTKEGQRLITEYCWVHQHRAFLEGIELQSQILNKVPGFRQAREIGMLPIKHADELNVKLAFLTKMEQLLDNKTPLAQAVREANTFAADTQFLYGIDSPLLWKSPIGRTMGMLMSFPLNYMRLMSKYANDGDWGRIVNIVGAQALTAFALTRVAGLDFSSTAPGDTVAGWFPLAYLNPAASTVPGRVISGGVNLVRSAITGDADAWDSAATEAMENLWYAVPFSVAGRRLVNTATAVVNGGAVFDDRGRLRYQKEGARPFDITQPYVVVPEVIRGVIGPTAEAGQRRREHRDSRQHEQEYRKLRGDAMAALFRYFETRSETDRNKFNQIQQTLRERGGRTITHADVRQEQRLRTTPALERQKMGLPEGYTPPPPTPTEWGANVLRDMLGIR